ncbi:MAG: hypothetical protein MJZ46_05885 [Bacteroidales bacterium]|nr:hypothetical protein [Bacteroidales bacterium]
MNKNPILFSKLKDFLFQIGIIRKKGYIIQKSDMNFFVSQITENFNKTQFSFCNDINNSLFFDDAEAACSFVSVYNVANFVVDKSENTINHKCFLVPVEAKRKYNKTAISRIA